jgi:hypothetical protein
MAIEHQRGCGYRKVGGLYLVGGSMAVPCDRLPIELGICPCCSQGIKFSRGFTWIDVPKLVGGRHILPAEFANFNSMMPVFPARPCNCTIEYGSIFTTIPCPLCKEPESIGRAGLLWVGTKFYPIPEHFVLEGKSLGFSRRIKSVPHDFKIGETWILLAHNKAIVKEVPAEDTPIPTTKRAFAPGIFFLWRPSRLERIYLESQRESEKVKADEKRGIVPVFVPDSDLDHQGSVHKQGKLFSEDTHVE